MLDDSTNKTMEIAAESTTPRNTGMLRRCWKGAVNCIGKTIDFLSGGRIGNWIRKKFLEKVCKLLFNDQREVAQILGFFVHNHNEQPVLYLNMLSDFARSVEDRTPVRTDHLGQVSSWSIYNIVNATASQKIRSTLSVNPEFYDALFCAHGIGGIDGYFRNLEDRKSQ